MPWYLQFSSVVTGDEVVPKPKKAYGTRWIDHKYNEVSPCKAAVQKQKQILYARQFFPPLFAMHMCRYNINLVTVLRY